MMMRRHFRPRRDTAANWQQKNPILKAGEIGWAYDTRVLKIGDGITPWNELIKVPTHEAAA